MTLFNVLSFSFLQAHNATLIFIMQVYKEQCRLLVGKEQTPVQDKLPRHKYLRKFYDPYRFFIQTASSSSDTVIVLQKTIRAYWLKRLVETNGRSQNHPNSIEIVITWCYRKPLHFVLPPYKVSNHIMNKGFEKFHHPVHYPKTVQTVQVWHHLSLPGENSNTKHLR